MAAKDARTGRLVLGVAEFSPLLLFVYAGRAGAGLSERFFWAAGLALAVTLLLAALRRRPNPLLVAANVWLCIEALVFLVHIPVLAEALRSLRESAYFITTILIGAGYAAFSRRGLLTVASDDRRQVRSYSFVLLVLIVGGLGCPVAFRGDEVLAASLPASVIFLAQMLMNVHLRDGSVVPWRRRGGSTSR